MNQPKVQGLIEFAKLIASVSKRIRERRKARKDVLGNDATPLFGFRSKVLEEFENIDEDQEKQNTLIQELINKNEELENRLSKLEASDKYIKEQNTQTKAQEPTKIPAPAIQSK